MSLFEKCNSFTKAEEVKATGLYPYFRAVQHNQGPVVIMDGRRIIQAGSNDYLGLTMHPKVKEAAIKAVELHGTSCSGSRFLTGTTEMHEELEEKLARFMGKESTLIYSTGYQTGQGVLTTLVNRGDYLLSDRENHASIVAGNLMASSLGVKVKRYQHNDMKDLERILKTLPKTGKMIVTDAVFSTFGGIVDLEPLTELCKYYNANLLLDDAHGFGVIGEGGRGTASHFGLSDEVDLIMCTFSKSLSSLGGFVAGPERVINYLKHHSSALIFSASPAPASVAAATAALEVLQEEPERVNQVTRNADRIRKGLRELGFRVQDGQTAIVPVLIGDDDLVLKMWKMLYDLGVFTNTFVSPGTPPGKQMLRISLMATHKEEHLDFIVDAFRKAKEKFNLEPVQ